MLIQDLSEKQRNSIKEANARINIWEGAVRSGKSFASIIKFLDNIVHGPKGPYIAVGKTNTTIKRNLVDPLLEMLGVDVRYYAGKQEMELYDRTIVIVGANDERSEGKIRGNTYAGAYIDEVTLIPESFFVTLLARLSIPGAQIIATTNPDSPFHWLKKNYLDREGELDIKRFQFNLDDNPSLTKTFKDQLKREFRGLWYKRFIEGEWVLAQGAIYDFFEESLHCIDFSPTSAKFYVLGIDYGTTNPCAFTLVGYDPNNYPNIWVEDEYYWDSREKNRQKTDSEYAADLKNFLVRYPNVKAIVIDPSAASFKAELIKAGFSNLIDAKNEVLDGIRFTSKLLSNGTLKIAKKCKNLIKEISTYCWDDKSIKLGEDKPLKQNDHCFAEGTMIDTLSGKIPIEMIGRGEKILTPNGYKTVLKTFKREAFVNEYEILGQKIKCTPEHRFYTANRGWIKACDLIHSDMFLLNISENICQTQLNGMEKPTGNIPILAEETIDYITKIIRQVEIHRPIYIEMYGNSIMEKFQKDTIFITSTKIPQTMTLAISNVYHLINIYPNISLLFQKNKKKIEENIVSLLDHLPKNGMLPKKEKDGINVMQSIQLGKLNQPSTSVNNAQRNIIQKLNKDQNFVRITVNLDGEETITLTMSVKNVLDVTNYSEQINSQKLNIAQFPVEEKNTGETVYNLEIEDIPVYFANNILVHNCCDSLRYTMFTYFKPIYDGTAEKDVEAYRRWKADYGWR